MSQPEQIGLLTSEQIKNALLHWHSNGQAVQPLAMLYLYRKTLRETLQTSRHVTNQLLLQGLEQLKALDDGAATLLEMRFLDARQVNYLARRFNVSESTIYVNQRDAIEALTAIIIDLDAAARVAQQELLYQRLESPTYVNLVGVDSHVEQLLNQLCAPQAPWLVALEGLGGIGKTSLAHQTVQRLIRQGNFDDVAWLTARREALTLAGTIATVDEPVLTAEQLIELLAYQLMPEVALAQRDNPAALLRLLRRRLKQFPHLVVVDNLETLVDFETLLPTLQDLANPSKFLLTSRAALYAVPNIYHFRVPELSEAAAFALMRQEIKIANLDELASWRDDELRLVFETVGGNPLALRLVVGQTHIYTLSSILDYLRAARGQTAEQLYTFIYWHTWQSLDPISQDVLLIMPLANPDGDDLDTISEIGELAVDVVRSALHRLVTFSLVDVRGGLQERRYSIHGLTRTFLHEQVLRWRRGDNGQMGGQTGQ